MRAIYEYLITPFQQVINLSQLFISPQVILPECAQPRVGHTVTALKFRTRADLMFGGCPKWESVQLDDALLKIARTTVLDFGEQNTTLFICLLLIVAYSYLVLLLIIKSRQ